MADHRIKLVDIAIFQQDKLVLKKVNLEIFPGEWVYLIGKVGSGKSSLIKTLNAELPVFQGQAEVAGYDLRKIRYAEIPFLRRKLGIIFQDFRLLNDRNVYENLAFVLKATGWNQRKAIQMRILEVVDRVGMTDQLQQMPFELSGGEQQRVVVARALLNHPDIILADEPTGNLDPATAMDLVECIREINRQGKTVVMATHDYSLLPKFPGRTLLLQNKELKSSVLAGREKADELPHFG